MASGMGVGLLAWRFVAWMPLLLALPLAASLAYRRRSVFALMLGYFGVGSAALTGVIHTFFHGAAAPWMAYGAPLMLAVVLACPFLIYNPAAPPLQRAGTYLAALVVLTAPPIGMLAWMNPLMIAGALFPQTQWVGVLLAAVSLSTLAALRVDRGVVVAASTLLIATGMRATVPAYTLPIHGFVGISTTEAPGRSASDELTITHRLSERIDAALKTPGIRAMVFPESLLSPYRPVDDAILFDAGERARKQGVAVVFGATMLQDAAGTRWRDAVMGTGSLAADGSPTVIDEPRLLMPVGNWHVGFPGGATPHPFTSDRGELAGVPVAWSICYEDVVLWPHPFLLGLAKGRPQMMISMRNEWALKGTFAQQIQAQSATLLSRLGGVTLLVAEND